MYWPALLCASKIVIDAESLRSDFSQFFSDKFEYIPYQAPKPHEGCLSKANLDGLLLLKPFMLVIARLEPENNIELIINAFLKLDVNDIDLVIVGGLKTNYYLKKLSNFQSSRVRFLGPIYNQKVLDGLRTRSVAYIHGHTVGGTNPSLLEALSTVTGAIYCHSNKYNIEVAGSEASYFIAENELLSLMKISVNEFRGGITKKRIPSWDARYMPEVISWKYLNLFRRVYASR
jgi:rhamnosyltransferase